MGDLKRRDVRTVTRAMNKQYQRKFDLEKKKQKFNQFIDRRKQLNRQKADNDVLVS